MNADALFQVVGASRGIGLASAKAFAQSGASVFLGARNVASLDKIAKDLKAKYDVPVGYSALDVTSEESIKNAVASLIATFGKIDIVIANGMVPSTPGIGLQGVLLTSFLGPLLLL